MSVFDDFKEITKLSNLENKQGLAYYFEGIPDERNEYLNILFRLSHNCNINFITDFKINNDIMTKSILEVKEAFKIKDMSQEPFIINKFVNNVFTDNKEFKDKFKQVVNEYKNYESARLTYDSLINFCGGLSYLFDTNRQDKPTIVYYGNITKRKLYCLRLLNLLQYNVILINTFENSPKALIPIIEDYFQKIKFKNQEHDIDIPDKEIIEAIETNAYKAEQQVNLYYGTNNDKIEKLVNIPIKTSYDDLENLWLTPVNERKGYKIESGIKYIPNYVCKINGVEDDEEKFLDKINKLIIGDTIVFNSAFGDNKQGNLNRLLILKKNIKNIITEKLNEINYNNKESLISNKLLGIVQLMDKENYNPKLIIFHNDEIPITNLDPYKFYQSLGFDILMISPVGYSGIEELDNCNLYELNKYDRNFKFKIKRATDDQKEESTLNKFFRKLTGG